MTRFARAKGSKASNERVHGEATPWHVMKAQLDSSATSKEIKERTKSAKELLKEKDDLYYSDTVGNQKVDWAEFEPEQTTKQNGIAGNKRKLSETDKKPEVTANKGHKLKKKKLTNVEKDDDSKSTPAPAESNVDKDNNSSASAPEKSNNPGGNVDTNSAQNNTPSSHAKDMKKKKKPVKKIVNEKLDSNPIENSNTSRTESKPEKAAETKQLEGEEKPSECGKIVEGEEKSSEGDKKPTGKLSKRQKRNLKHKTKNEMNNSSTPGESNGPGPKQNVNTNLPRNNFQGPNNKFNKNQPQKRKPAKIRDDLEHKRRKPEPRGQKVIINGVQVEIVHYDGFPVRQEDAVRLRDLREQMVLKGIPRKQIEAAMKLERRKAEKALTRIKKVVCFHCRKAGHNLSDCPELGQEVTTGICFKCGSTEHTHFECKVNKKEDFRFASCFICREQGHIAKQCPDNPKGLYPQGGACKVCGDVTHLKKDCPDLQLQKEDNTMKLGTIDNSNLESFGDDSSNKRTDESKKPAKAVVKF